MMPGLSWTQSGADSHATLSAYQESLPVKLIATARPDFKTCRIDEQLSVVFDRNRHDSFDYLPVISKSPNRSESIVGVLHIRALQADGGYVGAVCDHMEPLCEGHLIGADASVLTFVRHADDSPFRLVVSGREITGLVSISDLQRLPVRAALFAMVTHLEMVMADAIRRRQPNSDRWMSLLSEGRKKKVYEQIERAKSGDTFVDPVLYTQFCDKVRIVNKMGGPADSGAWDAKLFQRDMKDFQDLRDGLAHANDYATYPRYSSESVPVREGDGFLDSIVCRVGLRAGPQKRRASLNEE